MLLRQGRMETSLLCCHNMQPCLHGVHCRGVLLLSCLANKQSRCIQCKYHNMQHKQPSKHWLFVLEPVGLCRSWCWEQPGAAPGTTIAEVTFQGSTGGHKLGPQCQRGTQWPVLCWHLLCSSCSLGSVGQELRLRPWWLWSTARHWDV